MAKFTLQNVRLFIDSADLTTVNNKVELSAEAEEKESTAFVATGSAWKESLAGIRSVSMSASGQWEAADASKVDNVGFADIGTVKPWTVCPATAALGSLAWFTGFMASSYQVGGAVGDVAPWSAQGKGNWPLVRGLVLQPPTATAGVSMTGTGVRIIGGVPSGQSLYAALHVMSVTGTASPTFASFVESDDNAGFTTPVHRINFATVTAAGSQILRLAGPLTDDYFRIYADVTGTGPSFLVFAAFGIA